MSLTVTILIHDNTPLDPGVNLQLLDGERVVATARTAGNGTAIFDADPATLTSPAVRLAPQQDRPG